MSWYYLSVICPISYVSDNHHLPWDRRGLSYNEGITLDTIDYLDRHGDSLEDEWDWDHLSAVLSITVIRVTTSRDDLLPSRPWTRDSISYNPGATLDDVLYLDISNGDYNWQHLSEVLPIREIMSRPDLPWDREFLSSNEGITMEIIEYLDVYPNIQGDWSWDILGTILPMSDIVRYIRDNTHPHVTWDRYYLSDNPGITMAYIQELDRLGHNLEDRWNWVVIAKIVPMSDIIASGLVDISYLSRIVPMSYIRDNPDLPWDKRDLSHNKGITIDIIEYLGIHGDWSWAYLSRALPIREIMSRPHLPWHRRFLSMNKGITMDIIPILDMYPDIQGRWYWYAIAKTAPISDIVAGIKEGIYPVTIRDRNYLSGNPTLTIGYIRKIDTLPGLRSIWDWEIISKVVPIPDIMAYAIP